MNFTLVQKRHIGERSKRMMQLIASALEETQPGRLVKEVRRKMGISHAKFHNRKKNYGGLRPFRIAAVASIGGGEQQAQAAGSRLELGQ
jgi:hypothetical protein